MLPDKIGRYEIKGELGKGSMATVYCAHDPYFERDVALKLMAKDTIRDTNFRARFAREAKITAALEHPAIVPVYDFGDYNLQSYLVMRYMTGGSLAMRLKNGAFTLESTCAVINRLASALDEAHSKSVIHRDLKPSNVLLDQRGDVYLTDFGIAKLLVSGDTPLTKNGVVGTPAYMSPEQAKGQEPIDRHSDIYSLGLILFELLIGKRPYEAGDNPMQYALMHVVAPVPRILEFDPSLPLGLDLIITRALAKDPGERYDSAGELARELQRIIQPPSDEEVPISDDTPTDKVRIENSPTEQVRLPEPSRAVLSHQDGTQIVLTPPQFRVGRKPSMDLDLTDWDAGKYVSRYHATLVFRDEEWYVSHQAGARNPTRVNGQALAAGVEQSLKSGDEVQFANVSFRFQKD